MRAKSSEWNHLRILYVEEEAHEEAEEETPKDETKIQVEAGYEMGFLHLNFYIFFMGQVHSLWIHSYAIDLEKLSAWFSLNSTVLVCGDGRAYIDYTEEVSWLQVGIGLGWAGGSRIAELLQPRPLDAMQIQEDSISLNT
ncbi:hypothetical protein ACH5RR_027682 [Cinchona calisaya]|uniref:Uncharacterized protein n=1 Tax=Cinchona calisaya TaxID=153742 RepID=A0ABD2YLJ6_9GENT